MSNDLISRKALIEKLDEWCGSQTYLISEEVWKIIKNFPKAFDKEKVIEELDKLTGEECTLHECGIRSERCKPCIAKKALDEIQQYREIGTVEECRKAVEKQKAKKLDIYTDTRNMVDLHGNVYAEQANVYLCPTCESFIGYVGNNIFYYCPVCGQAIDENLEGMEDERD